MDELAYNSRDSDPEKCQSSRESVCAGLVAAGYILEGEVYRKEYTSEYSIAVLFSPNVLVMSVWDVHVGEITKGALAQQHRFGWWQWGGELMRLDASELISKILTRADRWIYEASIGALSQDVHAYLIAKLACVRDTHRFLELLELVSLLNPNTRAAVLGIIRLHGGEIERVARNWLAARELL